MAYLRSMVLVLLQFAFIAALLWPLPRTAPPLAAIVLLITALVVGLTAVLANRPGNFNIRPDAKPGAHLVISGPYRYVRHPMYVAVLLAGAGMLAWTPGWIHALEWIALALVLHVKSSVEEASMLRTHPDYAAYRARTARWIPFVW